jgi:hypothetical protein
MNREVVTEVGLREALETALSVALHEQADPGCSGVPPYDVTHEQAIAITEAMLRTPIVRAALAAPSRGAGLDVDRLARAITNVDSGPGWEVLDGDRESATNYAAEYERLRNE